jgi:hypothetical protein
MGSSVITERKHAEWQYQICQSPDVVSTVMRHGSVSESEISLPQKTQGPPKWTPTPCSLMAG